MTDDPEKRWDDGWRQAWRTALSTAASQLGYDEPLAATSALIAEREDAIRTLRDVCEEFGDNDWAADLHLSDIIEKHLGRNLRVEADDD